jgi:dephospho-CoA kinase
VSETSPARRRFLLAGLTGGIATGKSTVSAMFAFLDCRVIDADQLAREVVMAGQPAHAAIVREFGAAVVQEDGSLDRKRLGAIVFADPERRKRLEAITHPAIRAQQGRILATYEEECFDGIVIWDAALLIETGGAALVERVVLVYAEPAVQLRRLMARDSIGEGEARARIASQMPIGDKRRFAHHVIDNSGTRTQTERQVQDVHRALLADLRSGRAPSAADTRSPSSSRARDPSSGQGGLG